MGHLCGSTCKRKMDNPLPCETCRRGVGKTRHATDQEIGAAVDMYFDGLSYRRAAENVGEYFGRETNPATVYRWVQTQSEKANEIVKDGKVQTGDEWVADEIQVTVGGRKYWLFNVMDSDSRFVLAAYLSPSRDARAAATAMALARERSENPPKTIKTDGLRSYREGVGRAFSELYGQARGISGNPSGNQ